MLNDRVYTAQALRSWSDVVTLPENLEQLLTALDEVQNAPEPTPVLPSNPAQITAEGVEAYARELATAREHQNAQQQLSLYVATHVLNQAKAAVPELLKQLDTRVQAAVKTYTAAVEAMGTRPVSSRSLVDSAKAVENYQAAKGAAQVLFAADSFLAGLRSVGYGAAQLPMAQDGDSILLRLCRPETPAQLRALRAARGVEGSQDSAEKAIGHVYAVAVREGIALGVNTYEDRKALMQSINDQLEAGKPQKRGYVKLGK